MAYTLMAKTLLAVFVTSLAATTIACASSGGDATHAESSGGAQSEIASLHQSKCGNCHRLVEPTTRTRPLIVEALGRHEKRVHLSTAQWSALTDYLAPDTTTVQAKSTTDVTATR